MIAKNINIYNLNKSNNKLNNFDQIFNKKRNNNVCKVLINKFLRKANSNFVK